MAKKTGKKTETKSEAREPRKARSANPLQRKPKLLCKRHRDAAEKESK
jgi:hypothetical protein